MYDSKSWFTGLIATKVRTVTSTKSHHRPGALKQLAKKSLLRNKHDLLDPGRAAVIPYERWDIVEFDLRILTR